MAEDRKKELEGYIASGKESQRVYNDSPYKDKTRDKETRANMAATQSENEKELKGLSRPPMSKKWIEK